MYKMKDRTGMRYGKLTIIKPVDNYNPKSLEYVCQCDCGTIKVIKYSSLQSGKTRSCGCIKKGSQESKSRLYKIWIGIKNRAYTYSKPSKYYSEKGITMCEEWEKSYLLFKSWALENGYNDTLSIDRIDGNGNYCPENCRWVTPETQANNCSSCIHITLNGETKTLAQWCRALSLNRDTIRNYKIRKNVSYEESIRHFINDAL